MPDFWWQFGGGSPLPPIGGGSPGGGGNLPWWAYLGEETGFFDWVGETIFGQAGGSGGGGSSTGGGYPTSVSGIPQDFVSSLLAPTLQGGEVNRQRALKSYEENPDIIQRFLDWLRTLGAAASLLSQLATGSIFEWPGILQDLILLFTHDKPAADSVAPDVVREANNLIGPSLPTVGGFGGYGAALMKYKPPILPAEPVIAVKSRPGYVVVTDPQTGQKALMIREMARAAGLFKARKKPPISAKDWEAAKKAKRIEAKLSKMLQGSCNYKVTKKR